MAWFVVQHDRLKCEARFSLQLDARAQDRACLFLMFVFAACQVSFRYRQARSKFTFKQSPFEMFKLRIDRMLHGHGDGVFARCVACPHHLKLLRQARDDGFRRI